MARAARSILSLRNCWGTIRWLFPWGHTPQTPILPARHHWAGNLTFVAVRTSAPVAAAAAWAQPISRGYGRSDRRLAGAASGLAGLIVTLCKLGCAPEYFMFPRISCVCMEMWVEVKVHSYHAMRTCVPVHDTPGAYAFPYSTCGVIWLSRAITCAACNGACWWRSVGNGPAGGGPCGPIVLTATVLKPL